MAKKKKRTLKKKHASKNASRKHIKKQSPKKKLKRSYSPKPKRARSGTTFMLEEVVSPSPDPPTQSPKP
jgi:hypothetical protein